MYQVFLKGDYTPVAASTGKPAVSAVASGDGATTTTVPLEPELPNGIFDELTLRDPFEPIGQVDTGGSDGGTTVTTATTSPDTTGTIPTTPTTSPAQNPAAGTQVALLDITDLGGGVLQARVRVDGTEYSVQAGQQQSQTPLFIQGLDSTGTVQVTASAPGYTSKVATITLGPSGFVFNPFSIGPNFTTTSLSADTNLQLLPSLLSATLSFEKLHRWQSVFPWREWRTGRQLEQSRLIAEEFTKLANP